VENDNQRRIMDSMLKAMGVAAEDLVRALAWDRQTAVAVRRWDRRRDRA
jgi:hypothetical protein